jgi:hypothetical protein
MRVRIALTLFVALVLALLAVPAESRVSTELSDNETAVVPAMGWDAAY